MQFMCSICFHWLLRVLVDATTTVYIWTFDPWVIRATTPGRRTLGVRGARAVTASSLALGEVRGSSPRIFVGRRCFSLGSTLGAIWRMLDCEGSTAEIYMCLQGVPAGTRAPDREIYVRANS